MRHNKIMVSVCIVALAAACTDGDGESIFNEPDNVTPECAQYLSCLSAVNPDEYAEALDSYGNESACWDTDSQSDTCSSTCSALMEDYDSRCSCDGASCDEQLLALRAGWYNDPGKNVLTLEPCGYNMEFHIQSLNDLFSNTEEPVIKYYKIYDQEGTVLNGAHGDDSIVFRGAVEVSAFIDPDGPGTFTLEVPYLNEADAIEREEFEVNFTMSISLLGMQCDVSRAGKTIYLGEPPPRP